MELITPLSTPEGRKYKEALPQFSEEESKKGHVRAVGYSVSYLVYRCSWDDRLKQTNWNFQYFAGDHYNELHAGLIKYP